MKKLQRILVAVDRSSCSLAALQQALELADQLGGAHIDVLYVAELPTFRAEPRVASSRGETTLREFALQEARTELEAFVNSVPAEQRSKLELQVDAGRPRDIILERGKAYDLLVMGTHGRTGRPHSLAGSVTESVVRMAPCPVLAVREAA